MNTIVVGVGAVGSVVADILTDSEEFDKVIVADIDFKKARNMEKRLSNDKVSSMRIDATDVKGMSKAFKGVDLVVNGVIPKFNFNIMDACLAAKANYADMASDIFLSKDDPSATQPSKKNQPMKGIGLDAGSMVGILTDDQVDYARRLSPDCRSDSIHLLRASWTISTRSTTSTLGFLLWLDSRL